VDEKILFYASFVFVMFELEILLMSKKGCTKYKNQRVFLGMETCFNKNYAAV